MDFKLPEFVQARPGQLAVRRLGSCGAPKNGPGQRPLSQQCPMQLEQACLSPMGLMLFSTTDLRTFEIRHSVS